MKNLKEYLVEKQEITNDKLAKIRSLKSHTDTWNSLVNWYDKAIRHMNSTEVSELLRVAADKIDNANFDKMK